MRLKDKVAIVTGAGSGNGATIAKGYLKEGAKVVFADINLQSAQQSALESGVSEDQWLVKQLDVGIKASVEECVDETVKRFGRLDILVANAGVSFGKNFLETTEEDLDRVLQVNVKGVFFCSQAAARVMAAQESGGVIITMSSLTSITAPKPNLVHYGASKGAVLSMTRHMALDLGKLNIRVNDIAPGIIRTNMNHARLSVPGEEERDSKDNMLGRIGEPDDLVGAAIFLASEESSFMTGAQIVIDGGQTVY